MKNPAKTNTAKPPKGHSGTHRAITDEERELIHKVDHRMRNAALIMLYAGLRRGEVIRLTYEDIHDGFVHVSGGVRYDSNQAILTGGKTDNAVRDIPALGAVAEMQGKGLIIPSAKGCICTEIAFKRAWESYMKKLSEAAGHPISFRCHDLRHSFVTWCCDNDVNIKTVVLWCGHADEKMIMKVYDHVRNVRVDAQIDKLKLSKWLSK